MEIYYDYRTIQEQEQVYISTIRVLEERNI